LIRYRTIASSAILLLLILAGCRGGRGNQQPVIDPELINLTKEQAFQQAETQYDARKWQRARKFYAHVYESYPNDPLGRRSLLRVADTYYQQGGVLNLVEAQYKYRDFLNRYPGSEFADYAMLQIAMVSFQQMERPDRDQTKTREAVEKFRDMLSAFPSSKHRPEAEEKLQEALDRLAKHEHLVAKFYMNRGNFDAAIIRLNGIVDTYPAYAERDATFFDLATSLESLGRKGEARLYFERVVAEFPESEFAQRAKERLRDISA
jgi:outer membrane protein assembly factor BamD